MEGFNYTFPAIRGIQAGMEFYVSMCPMMVIPKIFLYDEEELEPELRAQRTLNRSRIPELGKYLVENPKDYIFSALTASIDGDVLFEPVEEHGFERNLGKLTIPMTSRILINDGQHRRAAIVEALKQRPELGDETISVVFFIDTGLKRSQQMFADLNKHAVRPTKSLGILYDHRDPASELARKLTMVVPIFNGLTEMEKATISNRSIKLFTLSSIYQATQALLKKKKHEDISIQEEQLAIDYWNEVAKHVTDWNKVKAGETNAAFLRKNYIHAHGLALQVLGAIGAYLLEQFPDNWKRRLRKISTVDWSRDNATLWEGRALVGGRVSKAHNNVILTKNILKEILGLPLTKEEEKVEALFNKGMN
jgi:DNA sulfur modification protein DndB